jgi:hypothetical protein
MDTASDNRSDPGSVLDHLDDLDYPAAKRDLLRHAEENDATEEVLELLNRLPDRRYDSSTDVIQSLDNGEWLQNSEWTLRQT